jgi:hypothetical protein
VVQESEWVRGYRSPASQSQGGVQDSSVRVRWTAKKYNDHPASLRSDQWPF